LYNSIVPGVIQLTETSKVIPVRVTLLFTAIRLNSATFVSVGVNPSTSEANIHPLTNLCGIVEDIIPHVTTIELPHTAVDIISTHVACKRTPGSKTSANAEILFDLALTIAVIVSSAAITIS
jgi:hypothetical protein